MPNGTGRQDVYRTYRRSRPGRHCFRVAVGETDLWIEASWDCRADVEQLVKYYRRQIKVISIRIRSLNHLAALAGRPASPEVVARMITAGQPSGVGPMAAVACHQLRVECGLAERSRRKSGRRGKGVID